MDNLKRAQQEFIESLYAFDKASDASPIAERILPEDLDLDRELSRLFDLIDA